MDGGDVQVAEEWGGLSAAADENQLDLSEDEAVAAAVLAHGVVDGGEAAEVLNTLDVALDAHSSVEAVEAADEADDAGRGLTTKHGSGGGRLAGSVGNEEEVVHARGLGGHGELQRAVGGESQSRVELGEVVRGVDGVESGLGFGMAGGEARLREKGRGDGSGQEGRGTGKSKDRGGVERGPRADVADVPPEVLGGGITKREGDGADQRGSWVGRGKEVKERGARSGIRGGSQAQGRRSTRAVAVGNLEAIVGLRSDDGDIGGHLAIGWVTISVNGGDIEAAAGGTTRVRRNRVLTNKGGRRGKQRPGHLLGLTGEGQVDVGNWSGRVVGETSERVWAGVAADMTRGSGSRGGGHAVVARSGVNVLVLGADLGEEDGSMMADGRRGTRRSGEARAE